MGDPASWPQPSGLTPDGSSAFAAAFASARQDDAWWAQAELRTSQLIACIQPTRASEERRQAVADYVQRLIQQCFKCQVVTFGSVPLKTYLPDGDIDLTALSQHGELKETWAEDVHSALRKAEKDSKAEFRVKEVQYIHAEVKIIKCLVENIVVDISFNQTGGLCTLCFLEEVDRCINQNHLFKRSVILVKAWCYYESRILGAHHALISTYALETLVLYVFHVFHSSLRGPLEVLYTFLEYFSNFDWDKYCVSLWGPVPLSSLPGVAAADGAEPPRKNEGALLLTKAFLDTCSETYSVVPTTSDNQTRTFNVKFLNVLDPLRESNNLGRSVSKGNFYRIRSAFGYGARKLAGVLKCSTDNINAEVERFFSSTLERSCSGGRLDAAEPLSDKERTLVGIEKENGGKNLNSHTPEIYHAGPERLQLQYRGWPGLVGVSRPRDALDPAQLAGNVDGRGSFRNSGNLQKAVDTSFGSQQGKWQSLEPGPRRTSSAGNLTAALSETHPRQVDGMLEFMNAEAVEKTRVLNRGPNTGNVNASVTESPIDHNHGFPDASQLMSSRKDMGGTYFHQKEPNHDSMLHISSTEDLALKNFLMSTQRQGDTGASSNATNYYIMGMPGSSAEAAAVSSQENLHHAISHSGDQYVGLSSVRKASTPTVAEGGNWIGEQTTVEMMGAVDSGHHRVSHERVSQSVLWPPPFIQEQFHLHQRPAVTMSDSNGPTGYSFPPVQIPERPYSLVAPLVATSPLPLHLPSPASMLQQTGSRELKPPPITSKHPAEVGSEHDVTVHSLQDEASQIEKLGYEAVTNLVPSTLSYPHCNHLSSGGSGTPLHVLCLPPPYQAIDSAGLSLSTSVSLQLSSLSSIPVSPSNSFSPSVSKVASMGFSPSSHPWSLENVVVPSPEFLAAGTPHPYLTMYNTFPSLYFVPPILDGGVRVDLTNGLHVDGALEGLDGPETQAADDLWMRLNSQIGLGVGERLKAAGIPISTSYGKDRLNEEIGREGANHSDWTSDILRGDFEHYLRNLDYGRWCQNPQTPEPMLLPAHMLQQPSANVLQVHQHLQEASQKLNVNITHPHVLGSGPAVLLPSAGWEGMGSYQRHNFTGYGSEESSSKLGGSTSTYLSNHRQSYHHDRQAPSIGRGGNQHGTYRKYEPYGRVVEGNSSFIQDFEKNCSIPGIDCNEVYQMSAPWYHVGPVQEDKAEPQAQNSNAGMSTLLDTQSFETERVLDKTGLQQHVAERRDFLLGPSTSFTPVSVPILPVPTGGVPGGRWPLPHHKNSYWNPTGLVTPGPHAPQAYPHDSSVVHSTDSLEFGSFGPVLFGDMRISSTQLQLTQAYISGTPGTSGLTYSSGDRAQLSSSPKQSMVRLRLQQTMDA